MPSLGQSIISNPDEFEIAWKKEPDYLSAEVADKLDEADPLNDTPNLFERRKTKAMAAHSFSYPLKETLENIKKMHMLQANLLHDVHFDKHPDFKDSGHCFDRDRYKPALLSAQELLGFEDECEFNFTQNGMTDNLGKLMSTFLKVSKREWENDKRKIVMLGTEFNADQTMAHSTMGGVIADGQRSETKEASSRKSEDEILKIPHGENGVYDTQTIIDFIKSNADKTKMICLPDVVFNTLQRLELNKIFDATRDVIEKNKIIVLLDLAHGFANRKIDLKSMPVHGAVMCGYKHLPGGYDGTPVGFVVKRSLDLKNEFHPQQGWKANDSKKVWDHISGFNRDIAFTEGAVAFRTSNPMTLALLPAQTSLTTFGKIGWTKLFNKSECLTRYLLAQLQEHLVKTNQIEIITPLDPKQRGAGIALKMKNGLDVRAIEHKLKERGFEVDTRPPVMRVTAHYAHTTFADVHQFVQTFKLVVDKMLKPKVYESYKNWGMFALGATLVAGLCAVALGSSKSTSNTNTTPFKHP